jgi:hypothetical protein
MRMTDRGAKPLATDPHGSPWTNLINSIGFICDYPRNPWLNLQRLAFSGSFSPTRLLTSNFILPAFLSASMIT